MEYVPHARWIECKLLEKRQSAGGWDYRFACKNPDGIKKTFCVYDQSEVDADVIAKVKAGAFDSVNDCARWG